MNVQKSVTFLYTNNEATKIEIKESIPYMIEPKIIRYLGKHLTKEVKDLYSKTIEHLWKKLKRTQRNEKQSMLMDWKNKHC